MAFLQLTSRIRDMEGTGCYDQLKKTLLKSEL